MRSRLNTGKWQGLHALRRLEVFIAPPILVDDEAEVTRLLDLSKAEVEKAVDDLRRLVAGTTLDY